MIKIGMKDAETYVKMDDKNKDDNNGMESKANVQNNFKKLLTQMEKNAGRNFDL